MVQSCNGCHSSHHVRINRFYIFRIWDHYLENGLVYIYVSISEQWVDPTVCMDERKTTMPTY